MGILTKVAKGVAFGDVSNQAVRNILTEISKSISGNFTEQEMYDTLDFFDWKCPYTDKDLRPLIEENRGGYATDHVYPQNREWCGLNVKGNLIIVDSLANSKKGQDDVEHFLLTNTEVLGDIDIQIRQARLDKIKEFQKLCGYDPATIRKVVSPLMKDRYDEIRMEQIGCIQKVLDELKIVNINAISMQTDTPPAVSITEEKQHSRKSLPSIIFYPENEEQFKIELLQKKKARFVLTYDSGIIKTSPWKCETLDKNSNLRANIQSRPFWRKKNQEGLVKVEVFID